jgi:retinol dehydrogenase 12
MGFLWKGTAIVVVALVAILLARPHPELDWENHIIPMARQYTDNSEGILPLTGVTVVISGATNGIGLSLTRALSKLGATVIGMGRSSQKLAALTEEIPTVLPIKADFSDLASVARAADEIVKSTEKIDILINNAGMNHGGTNTWSTSPQGYDTVFVVNYLSHYLLTEKLATTIANSTKPMVVQLSSSYHRGVDGWDLVPTETQAPIASLPGGSPGFGIFRSQRSYANSKLAQILHARALKRRHPVLGKARVVSVCPTWVQTNITTSSGKHVCPPNLHSLSDFPHASFLGR